MFRPDDPLAPRAKTFQAPWHAQAMALVDSLVQQGRISAADWAVTLGAALRDAEADGLPDTDDTYYAAVVVALEALFESHIGVSQADIAQRRADWEAAYLRTPHGKPVVL